MENALNSVHLMPPEELAAGVGGWLGLIDGRHLTVTRSSEKHFVRFLEGAAAALEAAGFTVDRGAGI